MQEDPSKRREATVSPARQHARAARHPCPAMLWLILTSVSPASPAAQQKLARRGSSLVELRLHIRHKASGWEALSCNNIEAGCWGKSADGDGIGSEDGERASECRASGRMDWSGHGEPGCGLWSVEACWFGLISRRSGAAAAANNPGSIRL